MIVKCMHKYTDNELTICIYLCYSVAKVISKIKATYIELKMYTFLFFSVIICGTLELCRHYEIKYR